MTLPDASLEAPPPRHPPRLPAQGRELVVVAVFALIIVATRLHGYLLFHTLVEVSAAAIGLTAFSIAWNTRRSLDAPFLLIAGLSFGPVAVIDLLHALAYKGMGVFAADTPNLATELWIAARMVQVASLAIAALWPPADRVPSASAIIGACLGVGGVLVASILWWDVFPDCWREGQGLTPFKVGAEYVFIAVLVGALLALWRHREQLSPALRPYLFGIIALSIVEEACFTLYTDVYGVLNMTGHVLKLAAFYLIYTGLVRFGFAEPQATLYRRLSQLNARLTDEALRSNERASLALAAADGTAWDWDMRDAAPRLTPRHGDWIGVAGTPTMRQYLAHVAPEDQAALTEVLAPRTDRTPRGTDFRIDLPGRPTRWIHTVTRIHGDGDAASGTPVMLGLDLDITATKQAEQERIELHKALERTHADLERFTEILAHHLQEPVRMQFAFAQRLVRRLINPPPDIAEPLAYVQGGAARLRSLLRDVQLYLALGSLPPPPEPVAAGPVAERLRGQFADDLRAAGATLEIGPLPSVMVAESRLTDLFRVLLDNAMRYRAPSRPLWVRVEALPDTALPASDIKAGLTTLAVTDNGIGIAPEYRTRVFAVFERLTPGWEDDSTGIGLALARRIVEGCGGRIWIDDGVDGGISVRFLLPRLRPGGTSSSGALSPALYKDSAP